MFKRDVSIVVAVVFYCLCNGASAQTYPKKTFAVTTVHIDSMRNARGLDWFLPNHTAQGILGSIAAGMGIDPSYVALATAAIPQPAMQGEQTDYRIPVEPGYTYCASRIRVISIVPRGGGQASLMNVAANSQELQITTVTPRLPPGQGRSWIEADIQVYGILPAQQNEFVSKGICKNVTPQVFVWSCRGSDCDSGVEHGNPMEAGAAAPTMKEGWPDSPN